MNGWDGQRKGKKTCSTIFYASKIVLALCWVFQLVKNFDETCDVFSNVCNCKIQSEIEGFDVFMGGFTSLLWCLDDLAFGEDLLNQWFLVKLLNPLDLKVSSHFSGVLRSWKNKRCVYNHPKQDVLNVSLTSCCVGWYGRHN